MRIQEILEAKKLSKSVDDLDDNDKPESDADQDDVPHIVMQLRKALDVDGDYPITFKNGKKYKLKLKDIEQFVKIYDRLKPIDRETMQNLASKDIEGFHSALQTKEAPKPASSIKGSRYMSHFSGDHDDK
jgi:hypothetical protein